MATRTVRIALIVHATAIALVSLAAYAGVLSSWLAAASWPRFAGIGLDKPIHFLAYGSIGYWAGRLTADHRHRRWFLLLLLALAGAEELTQHLFATRSCDLGDAIANSLGIATFFWLGRRSAQALAKAAVQAKRGTL